MIGHTERTILDALHRRYNQRNGDSERWVRAEHVRNGLGYYGHHPDPDVRYAPLRIADFLAMDMWESHGLRVIGHEVKISRGDWLRELREPDKGEAWAQWCHEWYIVAPRGVVIPTELPSGWGLIEITPWLGVDAVHGARIRKRSIRPAPSPLPLPISFGIMRSVQATAARRSAVTR
jgi:hypothetical protein